MMKTLILFLCLAFQAPAALANPTHDESAPTMTTPDDTPRFVDQTRVHDPENGTVGNCAQAAVASVLGVPLEAVPDFTGGSLADDVQSDRDFWTRFDDYFAERGLVAHRLHGNVGLQALHLAAGPSERGVSHMVVRRGFDVVHDPHPSRAGLVDIEHVYLIAPLDIASWEQSPMRTPDETRHRRHLYGLPTSS